MPNPNPSNTSNREGTIRETAETIRDAADRFGSKLRSADPGEVVEDASEWASDMYHRANNWVRDNRMVGVVGLVAAVGLFGFYLGRTSSNRLSSDYLKSGEI